MTSQIRSLRRLACTAPQNFTHLLRPQILLKVCCGCFDAPRLHGAPSSGFHTSWLAYSHPVHACPLMTLPERAQTDAPTKAQLGPSMVRCATHGCKVVRHVVGCAQARQGCATSPVEQLALLFATTVRQGRRVAGSTHRPRRVLCGVHRRLRSRSTRENIDNTGPRLAAGQYGCRLDRV